MRKSAVRGIDFSPRIKEDASDNVNAPATPKRPGAGNRRYILMQTQANALSWPSAADFQRVTTASGKLLELAERLAWAVRPVYDGDDAGDAVTRPSFEELGRLSACVSLLECDLEHVQDALEGLKRARDAACPVAA